MFGVFKIVFISMFFPASIITLMGNIALSNASFKFSKVEPSLIILKKGESLDCDLENEIVGGKHIY